MTIELKRLPSGYTHLRGNGPCNWAQVPRWPCGERDLLDGAFPEASKEFLRECAKLLQQEIEE